MRFAYAALSLRKVVAIANVHLTSSPYGPELQRDGKSERPVLENERQTRLREIKPYLRPLARLSDAGVPTFLTGDFNSPSHLDEAFPWPVSRALAKAGFRDSSRNAHPDPAARPRPGHIEATSRFWVLARGAKPRISSAQPVYAPGETIRLSWGNAPGNKLDWSGSSPPPGRSTSTTTSASAMWERCPRAASQ